jgi:hypothetical protein
MKNRIKYYKYAVYFIVFLLLTLPVYVRLVRPGFYRMFDDMQVIRVEQMDKCFRDGQIPCRWVPDLGFGYGYPLYIYYSPLSYYVMEIAHLAGLSFIGAVKFGFILSVFLSAIFMYKLSNIFFGRVASIIASFFYIYAPFRAAGIYVRGAMGEAWGLAALPLLLFGFEYMFRNKNSKSIVVFALTILFFLTSHNLTVLMSIPLILGWFLIRLYQERDKKLLISYTFVASFLGFLLSAFFVLPVIFEKDLVHIETLTSGYFYYVSHFLSLRQIITDFHWGYGPSVVGSNDDVFLGIGPMHTALVMIFIVWVLKTRKVRKNLLWIFLIIIFLGSIFMSHGRSSFIWSSNEFFKIFQFPWRWIYLAVFSSSVLAGVLFEKLKTFRILIAFLAVTTFIIYSSFFKPYNWIEITDSEKLSGDNYIKQITASIYDYLPNSADKAPDNLPATSIEAVSGDLNIIDFERGTNWFEYDVKANVATELIIPTYDFPNWKVYVDGDEVDHNAKKPLGLVSFKIDEGNHNIYARLYNSWPRRLGDLLTVVGIFSVLALLIYENKTRKIKR